MTPPTRAVIAFLVLGAVLRTVQYAGQVSLWHDELAVARNIQDRSVRDLIARPLDHRQVAPVGFLVAVDASTQILGANELGLRGVPWLAGLLALLLFWRVAMRVATGAPLVAGMAIFAVSPALVWYGSSVKQYGTDVAASLLLVWIALRFLEHPESRRDAALGGAFGAFAILFSHPAVVTAFIIGCVLLVSMRGQWRTSRPSLVRLCSGWGAGALVAASSAMRLLDPATARFMQGFWREGFPPPLSEPLALIWWLPRQLFSAFAHFLTFLTPLPLVVLIAVPLVGLAVAGVPSLVRRDARSAAILAAPTAAAIVAAIAGLLPLRHRLALHAAWPMLIFAMVGLLAADTRLRARRPRIALALSYVAAAPLTAIVLLAARPPYDSGQETRPLIAELARRWKTSDGLYAYCGARHAMAFYGPRHGLHSWMANDCHDDPRAYLREVDAFRGQPRVWFLSMIFPDENATLVRAYLRAIGREEEVISGAAVAGPGGRIIDLYRYDLSDPAGLAVSTAADFRWPAPAER